jgi:hypothetical protein
MTATAEDSRSTVSTSSIAVDKVRQPDRLQVPRAGRLALLGKECNAYLVAERNSTFFPFTWHVAGAIVDALSRR